MAWRAIIVISCCLLTAGCGQIKNVFTPAKPPTPMPVPAQPERREPPPLPRLAPQLSPEQEGRLVDEANAKIQGAEQALQAIDARKLATDQQETFQTIYAFIVQARAALSRKDFSRALNLAQKAQILSDELSQANR